MVRTWLLVALVSLGPVAFANSWLGERAVVLQTVDPEAPLIDLAVFGKMVGDARIIALGEATHGTREIFQMKHRLIRYLVEAKGFEIFSIEANLPSAYLVDEYVQGGDGDAEDLIGGMHFWTWNTQEVRDLVEWMRVHNAAGGRIHFTGFDMQSPAQAAAIVWNMAERLDEGWAKSIKKRYRGKPGVEDLLDVVTEIDSRRTALASIYTPHQIEWMRRCARLVFQGLTKDPDVSDWKRRDAFMAENVAWIADMNPGKKIVLWAHNAHISRHDAGMGTHLAEAFGDAYLPVGFVLGKGRYRAVNLRRKRLDSASLGAPEAGSLDARFAATGIDLALVDLRKPGDVPAWLRSEVRMRSIGSAIIDDPYASVPVVNAFDLLLYIDRSSPARQLPRRARSAPSL